MANTSDKKAQPKKSAPAKSEPSKSSASSSTSASKSSASSAKPASTASSAGRSSRSRNESVAFLLTITGVLIALNVLLTFLPSVARFDTTSSRTFSLSEGSRRVVRDLEDDMTITAYFTAELPPPFNSTARYVRDILSEYESASGGHVHLVFVDPDDEEEAEEAERVGVQRVQHQAYQEDSVSIVEGYRGIVFEYLGERQTIAVVPEDTSGLEYTITMAIKQLTGEDIVVGVLSGHEGPTASEGLATLSAMLPTYTLRDVAATEAIPSDVAALLIIDPQTEITEEELRNIDAYVQRGGSLGVFGGVMKVNLESPDLAAEATNTGINRLLEAWGIEIEEAIIGDVHCGEVPLRTPRGQALVPYPPRLRIQVTEEQQRHAALFRVPAAELFFASPIVTTDDFTGTALVTTSNDAWSMRGESVSLRIRMPQEWQQEITGTDSFTLAVAVEAPEGGRLPSAFSGGSDDDAGETDGEARARVVVFGTSSPLRDEFLQGIPEQMRPALMAAALNTIDYLAQDSDLIAIRAKTIEEPPLDIPRGRQIVDAEQRARDALMSGDMEAAEAAVAERAEAVAEQEDAMAAWESRRNFIMYGNMFAIPFFVALFGIGRWQLRQRKKATLKL